MEVILRFLKRTVQPTVVVPMLHYYKQQLGSECEAAVLSTFLCQMAAEVSAGAVAALLPMASEATVGNNVASCGYNSPSPSLSQ